MVEIRYGDQYEIADLAGQTVSEAREQFRTGFGIPDKARAKLNGQKVKASLELDTVLNDDDKLSFAVAKSKGVYLVGALLLALACTGGVFAFGWVNATASLTGTVTQADFASVSANTTGINAIDWNGWGFFKGTITSTYPGHSSNGTPIFNVDTDASDYTGDLVVTVSIANAGDLATVYRVLGLELCMRYPDGTTVDINGDGTASATTDVALLTLKNGSIDMFYGGTENVCTVRVKSGFFITNIVGGGWGGATDDPVLFCEVAQR
jgi:hypothetical protein